MGALFDIFCCRRAEPEKKSTPKKKREAKREDKYILGQNEEEEVNYKSSLNWRLGEYVLKVKQRIIEL